MKVTQMTNPKITNQNDIDEYIEGLISKAENQ